MLMVLESWQYGWVSVTLFPCRFQHHLVKERNMHIKFDQSTVSDQLSLAPGYRCRTLSNIIDSNAEMKTRHK